MCFMFSGYSRIFPIDFPSSSKNSIPNIHYQNILPLHIFYGATRGSPSIAFVGGILQSDDSTSTYFVANLVDATIFFSEFMVIRLLLILSKEKGIFHINLYGESVLVIKCLNGSKYLHSYTLQSFLEDIQRLLECFSHFRFSHVYMTYNKEANVL
jgi:hypothetical protein